MQNIESTLHAMRLAVATSRKELNKILTYKSKLQHCLKIYDDQMEKVKIPQAQINLKNASLEMQKLQIQKNLNRCKKDLLLAEFAFYETTRKRALAEVSHKCVLEDFKVLQ